MWIARHHMVVDLDTAPDREAGVAGERGRGTDADRHHDEAGGDQRSVLELHALDLAVADNFGGVGAGQDRLTAPFERLLEQPARRFVELAFHQGRSEEHTSELQSLMRISYAVFCLKKKNKTHDIITTLAHYL